MGKRQYQKINSSKQVQEYMLSSNQKSNLRRKPINKKKLRQMVSARLSKKKIIKQNKDIKKQYIKVKNQRLNWKNLFSLVQTEYLNCPICLDYCICPVLTQCGHYYCLKCFEIAHRRSRYCCVCRSLIEITQYQPSAQLSKLFEEFLWQKADWSEAILYQARVEEVKKRQMRKKIAKLIMIGDKLDFRIESAWTQAKITNIIDSVIVIQYKNPFTSKYRKIKINRNSRLLAAFGYFTYFKKIKTKSTQLRRRIVPSRRYVRPISQYHCSHNEQQQITRQNEDEDRCNWQNMIYSSSSTLDSWFGYQMQASNAWLNIQGLQSEDDGQIIIYD